MSEINTDVLLRFAVRYNQQDFMQEAKSMTYNTDDFRDFRHKKDDDDDDFDNDDDDDEMDDDLIGLLFF